MHILPPYPKDCVLIEWQEKSQAFFLNEIKNGVPSSRPNQYDVLVVHVCKSYREAHLLIDFMEKTFKKENLSTNKIKAILKRLTTFSKAYAKVAEV